MSILLYFANQISDLQLTRLQAAVRAKFNASFFAAIMPNVNKARFSSTAFSFLNENREINVIQIRFNTRSWHADLMETIFEAEYSCCGNAWQGQRYFMIFT